MISLPLGEPPESPPDSGASRSFAQVNLRSGVPQGLRPTDPAVAEPAVAERLRLALAEHFKLVWRTLRRLGVEDGSVDDAAQQVFLTFAARLATVPAGMERGFLIGVCPGVAANARRRRTRSLEVPEDDDAEHEDLEGLTPEQLLEWKQRRRILDRALDSLTLDQRTVFVLFELEGLSLPEIAGSLGIPLGTATSRLRRARDAFLSWVSEQHNAGGAP